MAIVVQRIASKVDSSSNVGSCSFTGTPSTGNRCIVVGWQWEGKAFSTAVSDNASGGSNTYAGSERDHATDSQSAWIMHAPLDRTLSNLQMTVTIGSGAVFCASAIEVSGLLASPVDVTVTSDVTYTGTNPYYWDLASGTLSQAEEIIVRSISFPASGLSDYAITEQSWSSQTPTLIVENDGAGINSEYGTASYLIVSGTSGVTTQYSSNDSQGGTAPAVLVSFKGVGGAVSEWRNDYAPDRWQIFHNPR